MATTALSQWVHNRLTDHKAISGTDTARMFKQLWGRCSQQLHTTGLTTKSIPLLTQQEPNTGTNSYRLEEKVICYHFSSENNLPTFWLNALVVIRVKVDWSIQSKHRQVISELKLVTDNLFIYAAANWEATENAVGFPTLPFLSLRMAYNHCCY